MTDRTPKPCLHKIANHQHGTYACYVLDRCRCRPCADAHAAYNRERVRQQAYGRWDNYVDAEPARRHVRLLMAQGMGLKRIVAVSGVPSGSIWKLLYGKRQPDGTRTPSKQLPPAIGHRDKIAASRARNYATRAGWAPPLAWDDIDHDDRPATAVLDDDGLDDIAIERALTGDRSVRLTKAEKHEAVARWQARGQSLKELERRTGWPQ